MSCYLSVLFKKTRRTAKILPVRVFFKFRTEKYYKKTPKTPKTPKKPKKQHKKKMVIWQKKRENNKKCIFLCKKDVEEQ